MNEHCYVPIKLYLQNKWQARFGLWIIVGNPSSSQVQWLRDLSLGGLQLLLSCSVGGTQCLKDLVCQRIEAQWFQLISNTVICHKAAQKCVLFFFAPVGLHCCSWAFSSCSARASRCGSFSCVERGL